MMKKFFVMFIILLGISSEVYGLMPPSGYFFDDNCPKEKPFSYEGETEKNCIGGCDTLDAMPIRHGHEEDFLICENRETIDGISRLKVCPKEYPLRKFDDHCVPCEGIIYVKTKQDCDACPNLKFDEPFCYQCPVEKPLLSFLDKKCYDCETDYVEFSQQDCDVCPNRKYKNGFCYKKGSTEHSWKYQSEKFLKEAKEQMPNIDCY